MKFKTVTVPIILLLTLFGTGCSSIQTERIKLVKTKCPTMKIWEHNKTIPNFQLKFKSEEEKKKWIEENTGLLKYMKKLKQFALDKLVLIGLYEQQNLEANALRRDVNEKTNNTTN